MSDAFQFALLGLGAGAVYTLLAQGIVLIYRASGIVNFAHAAFAMFGAYVYVELLNRGLGTAAAITISVLATALLGYATYYAVMRPLRSAAPLARTIATLGVVTILTAVGTLRYQDQSIQVSSLLPDDVIRIGGMVVPGDRLWLCLIVVVLTAILYAAFRFTPFGRATSAVAENELSAASLGWSPDLIASVNWALGSALAAVAGILIAPLIGLSVSGITLLIVAALAAAVLGGFSSFPITLVGGLLIGILQSEASRYISESGWPQAIPFLVIMVVLVMRGKGLPLRSFVAERLPELGTGRIRPLATVVVALLVVVVLYVTPLGWTAHITVTIIWAIMLLSVVVLTGYTGQLSLAQFALGGVGALIAARLVFAGWRFEPALLVAVVATVAVGLVLGLPALRTRGVNLAVVTLGLGSAVAAVLFNSAKYMGDASGTPVGPQSFLGISIDAVFAPRTYAVFSLVFLVICGFMVTNLRRGASGRRMIAVRTNERAAAALGVSVTGTKLYAFAVSAGIAGLGGVLYGFRGYTVTYEDFTAFGSIGAVSLAVVGGVAYVVGAPAGAILAVGGVGAIVGDAIFGDNQGALLSLIGGIALILTLILNPDGLGRPNSEAVGRLAERFRRRKRVTSTVDLTLSDPVRVDPAPLQVDGISVRFGGVVALQTVSLRIEPGEIVGLIGPNGAGKTTFIDTVTGFVKPTEGTIKLGNQRIDGWRPHRRARAGLTRSFQSLELFDDVTVLDNIRTACDRPAFFAWIMDLVAPRSVPLPQVARAAILEFDLQDVLDRRPESLSYGRRRLVAIARALAAGPSVLLLDEPAAGLDEDESLELAHLIRKLATVWGIAVLVIEHDMGLVMRICDRVTVLDFGRVIAAGTPSEIRQNAHVVSAYLGDMTVAEADDSANAASGSYSK